MSFARFYEHLFHRAPSWVATSESSRLEVLKLLVYSFIKAGLLVMRKNTTRDWKYSKVFVEPLWIQISCELVLLQWRWFLGKFRKDFEPTLDEFLPDIYHQGNQKSSPELIFVNQLFYGLFGFNTKLVSFLVDQYLFYFSSTWPVSWELRSIQYLVTLCRLIRRRILELAIKRLLYQKLKMLG